ncbi:MAG: hypothetical protein N3E51_04460 [Candidatus Micrarchaeota archaeon]|nr:hypothetical protein [Candidatus Micrarchaeota archaeon]
MSEKKEKGEKAFHSFHGANGKPHPHAKRIFKPIEKIKIPINKSLPARKKQEQNAEWFISSMKTAGGFEKIKSLEHGQVKSFLKSDSLRIAFKDPDKLPEEQKNALISNIKKMGRHFSKALLEACGEDDGRNARLLIGNLYNSQVGKSALGKLGFLFALRLFLAARSLKDEERKKDFEYFKYPENLLPFGKLSAEQKDAYAKLEEYLKSGSLEAKKAFADYCDRQPENAAGLMKTENLRLLFEEALNANPDRVREILLLPPCRKVIEKAMESAEGVNTIGYLWNTNAGAKLIRSLLTGMRPWNFLASYNTVLMILRKQGDYLAYAVKHGITYRDKPGWEENPP